MSAAFVPTFTRLLTLHGRERAWHLASSVINALVLVTGVIVIAGIIFAEPLVRLFASDFAEIPGKLELTIYLTRIIFPFLTLIAVAAALMGMLNSLGHFFVPALSPAMYNVAIVVMSLALIPFAPSLGVEPITIVAIAHARGRHRPGRHSSAAASCARGFATSRFSTSAMKACTASCC